MAGNPNIPHIAVTTDFASTHSLHSDDGNLRRPNSILLDENEQVLSPESEHSPLTPLSNSLHPFHTRSPSDPGLLSPFSVSPTSATGGRTSLDVPPRSPAPSYTSSNEGSTIVPPSPTLSTQSSVHFATSTALRDNKPGDGNSSLGLLHTDRSVAKHGRKASWASSGEGHSSLEGTEPDHGGIGLSSLQRATSATTSVTAESPTHTHVESLWSRSRAKKDSGDSDGVTAISEIEGGNVSEHRNSGKGKAANPEEEEPKNTRINLEQDSADVDPAPFAFKPFALASMLDPKNLDVLEELGGVQGLLKGLGTNRHRGLRGLIKNASSDGRPGAGEGASQRHDREGLPGIVVTAPDELESGKDEDDEDEDEGYPVFQASLEERRRVYGPNVLPHRATKSLLSLMWLALKDKVLVWIIRICVRAALITGSLGSFVYCCSGFSFPWSVSRFWHTTTGRRTTRRLGRRGRYHGRYFHRGGCILPRTVNSFYNNSYRLWLVQ
jgi:P-type Ca2+ transporter type 2C